jgi:hypothetical protein
MLGSPPRRSRALALCLLLAAGCASTGGPRSERSSPDVLLASEMTDWSGDDLLSVIRRLRPRWINAPLAVSITGPVPRSVVVDDVRQRGGLEALRAVRAAIVAEVRFENARDATTRYGANMMSGAIVVRTKR